MKALGEWCTATSRPSRRLERRSRRRPYWTDRLTTGPLETDSLETDSLATDTLARLHTFRALISFGTETAGRATTTVATPFGTTLLALLIVLTGCAHTAPETDPLARWPHFRRHTLANGLRVVTVENKAEPVVALTAYVTTGGRTETAEYAGALHFIEHLVFKGGTPRFIPTNFRKIITSLGDESGGWTWDDEIQFGFQVPTLAFEEALDTFSESLMELQWTQKWFEDERQVVLQEIEKVSEQPWSKLWSAWDQLTYKEHAYGRAVIGDAKTIRAQSMEQLERYYNDRFRPNHMVVVVVGDISHQEALDRVTHHFGEYARGPESFELGVVEAPQTSARRRVIHSDGTTETRFLAGFRTVAARHEDTPGLMLLAELLGAPTVGLPGWLQRKKQWVTGLSVNYSFLVDHGQLNVQGQLTGEAGPVLAWLEQHLTTLEAFPHDAVQAAKRQLLARRAREWEAFGEQAQGLGLWFERMGEPSVKAFGARLAEQTPESLLALAKEYLTAERWVEAVLTPTGTAMGPRDPSRIAAADKMAAAPSVTRLSSNPPWRYSVGERRGRMVRYDFDSGLTLVVEPTTASPLVSATLWIAGGQWVEPKELPGLAIMTGRLIGSGSRSLTLAQWDRVTADKALSLSSVVHMPWMRTQEWRNVHARDGTSIEMTGLKREWRTLIELMGEAVRRPTFPATEVEKTRQQLLSEIDALGQNNLEAIKDQFYAAAYARHPYGRPTLGTAGSLKQIGRDTIVTFHGAHWGPDRMTLAVTGPVQPAQVAKAVAAAFAGPFQRSGPLPAVTEVAMLPAPERTVMVKRGRDQWCLNVGQPTIPASHPDFAALEVMMTIARGRHFYKYVYDLGVSYRSWVRIWPHRGPSPWISENDLAKKDFIASVAEVQRDLRNYGKQRFGSADLRVARDRLINRSLLDGQLGTWRSFETARAIGLGLPFDYRARRIDKLRDVTLGDVHRIAREVFAGAEPYTIISQ